MRGCGVEVGPHWLPHLTLVGVAGLEGEGQAGGAILGSLFVPALADDHALHVGVLARLQGLLPLPAQGQH